MKPQSRTSYGLFIKILNGLSEKDQINVGVIIEDSNRKLLICNQKFCDTFGIEVEPKLLIGSDCNEAAELVKDMFVDPDKFISDIDIILENKLTVEGEEITLKDGRVLIRDYFPIFSEGVYMGHAWEYKFKEKNNNGGKKTKL